MICLKCGNTIVDNAIFCPKCGAKIGVNTDHVESTIYRSEDRNPYTNGSMNYSNEDHYRNNMGNNYLSPIRYAGFWKRFAATLIDRIIQGIVFFIMYMFILIPMMMSMVGDMVDDPQMRGFLRDSQYVASNRNSIRDAEFIMNHGGNKIIIALITFFLGFAVISWLYFAIMESSKLKATLGKLALGIVVTDSNGNQITFLKATGRYFSKIVTSLTFSIGYMMAGFTEKKQALHDIMADSLVINK